MTVPGEPEYPPPILPPIPPLPNFPPPVPPKPYSPPPLDISTSIDSDTPKPFDIPWPYFRSMGRTCVLEGKEITTDEEKLHGLLVVEELVDAMLSDDEIIEVRQVEQRERQTYPWNRN